MISNISNKMESESERERECWKVCCKTFTAIIRVAIAMSERVSYFNFIRFAGRKLICFWVSFPISSVCFESDCN